MGKISAFMEDQISPGVLVLASNAATVAFYEKLGYSVEQRVSMGKLLGRGVVE